MEVYRGGNNTIQGNRIGTEVTGSTCCNQASGVCLYETSDNLVGGTQDRAGNLISGNIDDGINILVEDIDRVVIGNEIQGNLVGTNKDGHALTALSASNKLTVSPTKEISATEVVQSIVSNSNPVVLTQGAAKAIRLLLKLICINTFICHW